MNAFFSSNPVRESSPARAPRTEARPPSAASAASRGPRRRWGGRGAAEGGRGEQRGPRPGRSNNNYNNKDTLGEKVTIVAVSRKSCCCKKKFLTKSEVNRLDKFEKESLKEKSNDSLLTHKKQDKKKHFYLAHFLKKYFARNL